MNFVGVLEVKKMEMESWITGHHIYKRVWTPVIGQRLQCRQYRGNRIDPTALGVFNGSCLVGHAPRDIKDELLREIRRGRTITVIVTGGRENARGRGLEVPATYRVSDS